MRYRLGRNKNFDYCAGNAFRLLVDGEQFFPHMLAAIDGAKQIIFLEQYLVRSGKTFNLFINALCGAAQRGVAVYLLFDDFGSARVNQHDRQQLAAAGVQLTFYNPILFKRLEQNFFRTHRKILVIDHRLAYVGGAGITDDYHHHVDGSPPWHDVMLEMAGPIVADWQRLFCQTWQQCTKQVIQYNLPAPEQQQENQRGRILESRPIRPQEVKRALLLQIRKASRIWITTPYFIASHKIRRQLRRAAREGKDVRLLLPGPHSDIPWVSSAVRRFYRRFLKSGIRVFEYQPRFTHSKIELCDDWVSLGSSNLDRWNQHWTLDANQAVDDPEFAKVIEAYFMTDFANSREITLQTWQQRSFWARLKEQFSGWRIFWLAKLTHYFQHRKN